MFRLLLFSTVTLLSGFALADTPPVKIPVAFGTAYIPDGFDSNDQVQIVGEGMFSNSCYRAAEASVRVDKATKTVIIGPAAYEYNGFCLQVVLPFDRVVNIGILPAGQWRVIQKTDGSDLGTINVKQATTDNPDDYLYAPITQAFFHQHATMREVFLTGNFPNSCMSMDQVKITVQPKVIVVQPIAKMADRTDCKGGSFPFNTATGIDFLPEGRYLLHVRSMNGKAINTLVDVTAQSVIIPAVQ